PAMVTGELSLETFASETFAAIETIEAAGDEEHAETAEGDLSAADEMRLQKEVASVRFYIENGYTDLAERSIASLRSDLGAHIEIDKLEAELLLAGTSADGAAIPVSEITVEAPADNVPADTGDLTGAAKTFDLDEIRSEFGLEELDAADDEDYETHYNTAVAYQEMGLTEEAIREYQDAISLVQPNDGTRRFI